MIIEVILTVMTFVQCLEFFWLYRSSRRTNEILENPSPVIVGLIDALREDEKFREAFGSLIAWGGAIALQQAQAAITKAGKPPKIKSLGDAFGLLMQIPGIQASVENKISKLVGEAGPVAEVAKEAGWGV